MLLHVWIVVIHGNHSGNKMFKATLKYNKNADLNKVAKAMNKEVEEIRIELLGEAAIELMEATPIRTGRAAMGWSAAVREAGLQLPTLISPELDDVAMSEGEDASEVVKTRNSHSIINKVSYILDLELGSSTQAPSGFMKIAGRRVMKKVPDKMKPALRRSMKAGGWRT